MCTGCSSVYHVSVGVLNDQKRAADPLALKLQGLDSCLMWVGLENCTLAFCKSRKCSEPRSQLTTQCMPLFLKRKCFYYFMYLSACLICMYISATCVYLLPV